MRRNLSRLSLLLLGTMLLLFGTSPGHAQATRTWVSGVGDDANPCSRTAPCKTFAGAIVKTAPSGEISVLDPGGFGALTITKSISLTNDGVGEAGVLVSGTNGIVVAAGPNDVVNLRGLVIDGIGTGLSGIQFNSGAALHVQNCVIKNFIGAAGIAFTPNVTAQLHVSNTVVSNNGVGGSGGGVLVANLNAGAAQVFATLSHVRVEGNNGFGIKFDGTTGTGAIHGTIQDSVSAGNSGNGIWGTAVSTGVLISVNSSAAVNNAGTGVLSNGSALVLLNNSVMTGNGTGVNFTGGGTLLSYKNNSIDSNTTNGAPSGPLTPE